MTDENKAGKDENKLTLLWAPDGEDLIEHCLDKAELEEAKLEEVAKQKAHSKGDSAPSCKLS